MRERKYGVGKEWHSSGIRFRIVAGDKSTASFEDHKLEVLNNVGRWQPYNMMTTVEVTSVLCENEDFRYPNGEGGLMHLKQIVNGVYGSGVDSERVRMMLDRWLAEWGIAI